MQSEGVTTALYFRGAEAEAMAQPYGQEIGKMMSVLHRHVRAAAVRQSDGGRDGSGAPNGYAAPGMIFLAPRGIGKQVNAKLLANQISRQWWEELVSPATRNHLWLTNGLAAYSELLWTEHVNGPGAMETAAARRDGGSADGRQRAR